MVAWSTKQIADPRLIPMSVTILCLKMPTPLKITVVAIQIMRENAQRLTTMLRRHKTTGSSDESLGFVAACDSVGILHRRNLLVLVASCDSCWYIAPPQSAV